MRVRWVTACALLGGLALVAAARQGPRVLLGVLAAESGALASLLWWGARRFTAAPVHSRDGSGVAYHIGAGELFGIGAGALGVGRRLHGGALLVDYGPLGEYANPAYLAWWALAHTNRYADAWHEADRTTALAAAQALVRGARWPRHAEAAVWTYDFTWPVFGETLPAGWVSAMAQGLAISALVRAARLSGQRAYLDIARAAALPFARDARAGGVRTLLDGHPFYEEYPTSRGSGVLDGSLFGLLGLYDLWVETRDADVRALFDAGAAGIESHLHRWDYYGLWSRYGFRGHLSTPVYHELNAALLDALGRVSGRPALSALAARWRRVRTRRVRRALAYAAYQWSLYRTGLRQRLEEKTASRMWRGR